METAHNDPAPQAVKIFYYLVPQDTKNAFLTKKDTTKYLKLAESKAKSLKGYMEELEFDYKEGPERESYKKKCAVIEILLNYFDKSRNRERIRYVWHAFLLWVLRDKIDWEKVEEEVDWEAIAAAFSDA